MFGFENSKRWGSESLISGGVGSLFEVCNSTSFVQGRPDSFAYTVSFPVLLQFAGVSQAKKVLYMIIFTSHSLQLQSTCIPKILQQLKEISPQDFNFFSYS